LASGSIGLAEHEQRIRRPADRSRRCVLRHRSRDETAPFSPACVEARLALRLLNSFLSPVVKYHGLRRATGFGTVRRCSTLASLHVAHETACLPRTAWTSGASGPPDNHFQARNVVRCFLPSSVPAGPNCYPHSKTDNTTDRSFDHRLTASAAGCPTSACSRQAPSPRLRRSSGPCC